jgi:hypothetical protein
MVGLVAVGSLHALPARAGSIALTMTPTGLSNQLWGAYIGPYTVAVNSSGQTFQVICDDFLADTYIGESWTAAISSISNLAGKFSGFGVQRYDEVAFLGTALLNSSSACQAGSQCGGVNNSADIQYALWQVFDSTGSDTAFSHLSGNNLVNATDWLHLAQTQTYTPGQFSNVVIYTPTGCINGPGCSSGSTIGLPQEFIAIRNVPESGTLLLLGVGMACFALYRRHLRLPEPLQPTSGPASA